MPAPLSTRVGALLHRLGRWSNYAAVVFNALFAVLAITTLAGIVFITRPQQAMHDIPPWMWLPLLIIMAPAQLVSQYWAWRTIFSGQEPTGPAIAVRQQAIPYALKPTVALMWLLNFFIGIAIVASLSKPHPGAPPSVAAILFIGLIAFWLAFAANLYLSLAIRTVTENRELLERVWHYRVWIDLAMAISGVAYYRWFA
jgi:hypothetical protein